LKPLITPKKQRDDALAYHRELAAGWEGRYQKPSFRARLRVFEECLMGRDLRDQDWLDAGCGSGTLTRWLAAAGARVVGVDAAEEMIAQARQLSGQDERKLQVHYEHIATIADLPLPDRSLSGILCSSVLEYVSDPAACLAEFARVLRPGGLLVISVANRNSMVRWGQLATHRLGRLLGRRWWAFLDHSHNEYSAAGFRALLTERDFVTVKVIPFGSPIPEWLQRREFGGSLLSFSAVRR
jgi:2-polyprenyl-6-hydroxyphenyl methylase/3-demethylubiquinone-9 3-methyltransferase